jgi:hypothetical protein
VVALQGGHETRAVQRILSNLTRRGNPAFRGTKLGTWGLSRPYPLRPERTEYDADGQNLRDNSHVGLWDICWGCRVCQSCGASCQNAVRYKVSCNGVRSQLPQGLCDAGIPDGHRFRSRDGSLVNGRQFLLVGGRHLSLLCDSVHSDCHHADQQEIAESGPGQRIRTCCPSS